MDYYKPEELHLTKDGNGNIQAVACNLDVDGSVERILISASACYQPESGKLLGDLFRALSSPELFQLHFQKTDNTNETTFIEQTSVYCRRELDAWMKRVQKENPIPAGFQWLMCREDSEHFIKCAEPA